MKRLIAILLCAGLLGGCGGSGETHTTSGASAQIAVDGARLSGEITVSSFNAMPNKQFLETAAAMFEDKHQGVKVNVDIFSEMPEIKTMESPDGRSVAMMIASDENE